jgi:hypothetical protein
VSQIDPSILDEVVARVGRARRAGEDAAIDRAVPARAPRPRRPFAFGEPGDRAAEAAGLLRGDITDGVEESRAAYTQRRGLRDRLGTRTAGDDAARAELEAFRAEALEARMGELWDLASQFVTPIEGEPPASVNARIQTEVNRMAKAEGLAPGALASYGQEELPIGEAAVRSVQRGLVQTFGGIPAGLGIIGGTAMENLGIPGGAELREAGAKLGGDVEELVHGLYASGSVQEMGALPDFTDLNSVFRFFLERGPEAMVQIGGTMGPGIVGGLAAKAAGMAPRTAGLLGTGAAMVSGGGLEGNDAYQSAIALGADEEAAANAAVVHSGIAMAMEKTPAAEVLLKNRALQSRWKRAMRQAAIEASTEAPQEVSNAIAAYYASGDPRALEDIVERAAGAALLATMPGALIGGLTPNFQGDAPTAPRGPQSPAPAPSAGTLTEPTEADDEPQAGLVPEDELETWSIAPEATLEDLQEAEKAWGDQADVLDAQIRFGQLEPQEREILVGEREDVQERLDAIRGRIAEIKDADRERDTELGPATQTPPRDAIIDTVDTSGITRPAEPTEAPEPAISVEDRAQEIMDQEGVEPDEALEMARAEERQARREIEDLEESQEALEESIAGMEAELPGLNGYSLTQTEQLIEQARADLAEVEQQLERARSIAASEPQEAEQPATEGADADLAPDPATATDEELEAFVEQGIEQALGPGDTDTPSTTAPPPPGATQASPPDIGSVVYDADGLDYVVDQVFSIKTADVIPTRTGYQTSEQKDKASWSLSLRPNAPEPTSPVLVDKADFERGTFTTEPPTETTDEPPPAAAPPPAPTPARAPDQGAPPAGDTGSRGPAARGGVSPGATPPALTDKIAAARERLGKKRIEVDEQLGKALKDLGDYTTGRTFSTPLDPQLVRLAAKVVVAATKKGGVEFADVALLVAEQFPDRARALGRYLEAGWDRFRQIQTDLPDRDGLTMDAILGDEEGPPQTLADTKLGETLEQMKGEQGIKRQASEFFLKRFRDGAKYLTIVQASKEFLQATGRKIARDSVESKQLDEGIELAIVLRAREIIAESNTPEQAYDELVDLYNRQPNLAKRTGESERLQAFSTPAPLAYVASQLAGINNQTTVYEPSAGNGMLLIGARPDNVQANEIDPKRATDLEAQGFATVTQNDATEHTPKGKVDVVIGNPPFGVVRDPVSQKPQRFNLRIGGQSTRFIDHAISLKALESLKDDGRAVLIVGTGKKKPDDTGKYAADGHFGFWGGLYSKYRVVDHFTVEGKLYSKMGAAFPVDVIVIDQRAGEGAVRDFPAATPPERIGSYDELKERLNARVAVQQPADGVGEPGGPPRGADVDGGSGDTGAADTGRPPDVVEPDGGSPPVAGGTRRGDEPRRAGERADRPRTPDQPGQRSGRGGAREGDRAGAGVLSGEQGVSPAPGPPAEGTQAARDDTRNDRPPRSTVPRPRLSAAERQSQLEKVKAGETEFQTAYPPRSEVAPGEALMPPNMLEAVRQWMDQLEKLVGNVDEYVADKLNMTQEELADAFSPEQVDTLAGSIYQLDNQSGYVIGHQTGLGKGRIVAALLKYVASQGKLPVFMTEKPTLYGDIIRDLRDIGAGDMRGLATNAGLTGENQVTLDGEVVIKTPGSGWPEKVKKAIGGFVPGSGKKMVVATGLGKTKTAVEYDIVFTTYDQLRPAGKPWMTPRQKLFMDNADKMVFVLDESHNAGGSGDVGPPTSPNEGFSRAYVIRKLVEKSQGTVFSSATWAKRPDTLTLYINTSLNKLVNNASQDLDLADLLEKGGVPFQAVLSKMLSRAGQYFRLERSYKGVTMEPQTVPVEHETADAMAEIHKAVFDLSEQITEDLEGLKKEVKKQAKKLKKSKAGIATINFGSALQNATKQFMLAVKVDAIVDEMERVSKNNEKPVMVLENTMESIIDKIAEKRGLSAGDYHDLSYADIIGEYIDGARYYIIKHGDGESEKVYLEDADMSPAAKAIHDHAIAVLERSGLDKLPASPIDYIIQNATRRGIDVTEVTSRSMGIQYHKNGKTQLYRRPAESHSNRGKRAAIDGFNDGTYQGIVLNESGATGISLHASEKFKDQRPRRMLIGQAAGNVDVFMQMLGRIHRKGQVVLPRYSLLMSDIAFENRPAAVLMKKLASLNANVTADRRGSVGFDVPDVLNTVGDEVVWEYVKEAPEVIDRLGIDPTAADRDSPPRENFAQWATGRVAMLPTEQQAEFWEDVKQLFDDRIEELNAIGQNPLVVRALDLDAKTESILPVVPGKKDSVDPFDAPSYLLRVDAKMEGKPLKASQVRERLATYYGIENPDDLPGSFHELRTRKADEVLEQLEKDGDAYIASLIAKQEKEGIITARRAAVEGGKSHLRVMHHKYGVGTVVKLTTSDDDVVRGVVVNLHKTRKTANPAAIGAWQMVVATLDNRRILKVSLARVGTEHDESLGIETTGLRAIGGEATFRMGKKVEFESVYDAFDTLQFEGREQRYIISGNLVTGFAWARGKGQFISYTTDRGVVVSGIMLPRTWQPNKAVAGQPILMPKPELAAEYVIDKGLPLESMDRVLRIRQYGSGTEVSVPLAKAKGGKFRNDPQLDKILGQPFVKVGDRWVVRNLSRDKTIEAISYLQNERRIRVAAFEHKDLAREFLGLPSEQDEINQIGEEGGEDLEDLTGLQFMPAGPVGGPVSPSTGTVPKLWPLQPGRQPNRDDVTNAMVDAVEATGVEVPFRVGKVSGKDTRGQYDTRTRVLRTRQANDTTAQAHELGHALHDIVLGGRATRKLFTPAMNAELVSLGKLVYPGKTPPFGGWGKEGVAEFTRLWLSKDPSVGKLAPKFLKWWNESFLADHPKLAKKMRRARTVFAAYEALDPVAKADSDLGDGRVGVISRARSLLDADEFQTQFIEAFHPLDTLAGQAEEQMERVTGKPFKLTESANPYRLATFLRNSGPTRVRYMAERAMIDFAGNKVGPPLRQTFRLVKDAKREFVIYLWARRARSLWTDPQGERNPGMPLDQAVSIITTLEAEHPNFRHAAREFDAWNEGVLNYVGEASSVGARVVQAIRERDPGSYAPLWRLFQDLDDMRTRMGSRVYGDLAIRRLRGSGRRVRNIDEAVLVRTTMLVESAHRSAVIEAMVKLADVPGMGNIIERIPRDVVPKDYPILQVLRRLEEQGIGAYSLDPDVELEDLVHDALTLFSAAVTPRQGTPYVPLYHPDGGIAWYEVKDPELFWSVEGLSRLEIEGAWRLITTPLFGVAKTFRYGTTAMSPRFGLISNLARDAPVGWLQSESDGRFDQYARGWFAAMYHAARGRTVAEVMPDSALDDWFDVYRRLGVEMSERLNLDREVTSRATRQLTQGTAMRTIDPRNWIGHLHEFIQFPEAGPRMAEMKLVARDLGVLEPGQPLTLDEAITIGIAGRRATVDFSASGLSSFVRAWNRASPFLNASKEGLRSMGRSVENNPKKKIPRAIALLTIPALLNWWRYKDREWYRRLTPREKLLFEYFELPDGNMLRIPRPFDWGSMFMGLPVVLLDGWYTQDPDQLKAELGALFEQLNVLDGTNPLEMLASATHATRIGGELLANRDFFFDRPIVPPSEARRRTQDQYGVYTTRLARFLGTQLGWSPRKVDHVIRGMFGSVSVDVLSALGMGPPMQEREPELADIPVVGVLFRRGGVMGTYPRNVEKVYQLRRAADQRALIPDEEETRDEKRERQALNDAAGAISALMGLRRHTKSLGERQKITKEIGDIADDVLDFVEGGVTASERARARRARKQAERREERAERERER